MIPQVDDKKLREYRRFPRMIKLYDEYFEWVEEPDRFVTDLKATDVAADIFTFVQKGVVDGTPRYHFYHEWDEIAVLRLSTYEDWFQKQIKHEERNRIKRAEKNKVEVRLVEYSDELVQGIKKIYDEDPMRQGKHFRHYNKSFEEVKAENGTFPERSRFIGAFFQGELIGFLKMIRDGDVAYLMQVISMFAHRDKSPTNALMAKAVQVCIEEGMRYIRYGNWSRRGLGHFKKSHGFRSVRVPRYFIPLSGAGRIAMCLKLHREVTDLLPERLVDLAADVRNKCKEKLFHHQDLHQSQ